MNGLTNVLRRKSVFLIVFFVFVISTISFAQIIIDSTEIYVQLAEKFFDEKDYNAVINTTNKGLALYNVKEKDITYVDLLQYKAIAYNWVQDNRSAMPIYKEAVITFCDLFGEDNLPCQMGKNYIMIYRESHWDNYSDNVYVSCLHSVFRNNCISSDTSYKENLRFYKFYNEALTGFYSHNVDLDAENSFVLEIDDPLLQEYVKYAKGCREIQGISGIGRTRKDKLLGINIIEQVESGIKDSNTLAAKYLLYCAYSKIAQAFEELGNYEMAANNYKKSLELSQIYWRNWGENDPWCNLSNCFDAMKTAHMYSDIIECSNIALLDSNTSKQHIKLALDAQRDAYEVLGNTTKLEEINSILKNDSCFSNKSKKTPKGLSADDVIALYEKFELTEQIIDTISTSSFWNYNDSFRYEELFYYLCEKEDYEKVIQIASNLRCSLFNDIHPYDFITSGEFEEIDIDTVNEYDKAITCLRSLWHFVNGIDIAWVTSHYLAAAYSGMNDLANAIKYQKEAYDLVRLDWKYDPNEKADIIQSHLLKREEDFIIYYLYEEQSMSLYLAYLYLESKDYESAYEVLGKMLESVKETLSYQLVYGIYSEKYNTWGEWNQYIHDIIYLIINYVEQYPPIADLILECNSIIKGFMLNVYTETYNNATKTGNTYDLYTCIKQYERNEEAAYYIPSIPLSSITNLKENIERNYLELDDVIDYSEIVRHSGQSISEIKDRLGHDDVLVDFFTIRYDDEDCKKVIGREFDSIVNGEVEKFVKVRLFYNPSFYALIIRDGWEHTKVVELGNLASVPIDEARDLLDCVYLQKDYKTDINELYRSKTFGDTIWGRIIETGNIKKGENIFFCPTSYLNDVAIEYLTLGADGIMSEQYNMYRISTIRELNNQEALFEKGNRCTAFGNITYSPNKNTDKESITEPHRAIDLASSPKAMHNRDKLRGLDPTKGILKTISRRIPKANIISGEDATEESFYKLSGNSPELLVVFTHGYNYEREKLDDDDLVYLFGNRDYTFLSEREQSMYKSGLFMAQSPNNIPTNGMLTAKEISMCDLHNTKLAILAACVSAVGANTNEGVFGIQRGLKMAGVESMLVSLWDVDAEATQLLIEEFVRQYVKGVSPHKALLAAQQYVKEYKDEDLVGEKHIFSSPYFWAGFILID